MPSILTYNIKILFSGDKNRYSLKNIYVYRFAMLLSRCYLLTWG